MVMLLDEASVANLMAATFAHYDDGTATPFEVSTLHEVGCVWLSK